jgi:hypothetical protein
MADSASLKIGQAAKHVADLSELFRKNRPFSYCIETNTQTGQRATFAKKNEPIVNAAALICGDVVHNLRTALDHAYWLIVSPRVTTKRDQGLIQFPFSKTEARLRVAIQNRIAHWAGMGLYCAINRLKPHGDKGGNELLYFIHDADLIDKHRLLIPTANYTSLSSDEIRRQVPDFPVVNLQNVGMGGGYRDVVWTNRSVPTDQLGIVKPPTINIFERELEVPVEIVFNVAPLGNLRPVIPTLNKMVDTARQTIKIIREAALSA